MFPQWLPSLLDKRIANLQKILNHTQAQYWMGIFHVQLTCFAVITFPEHSTKTSVLIATAGTTPLLPSNTDANPCPLTGSIVQTRVGYTRGGVSCSTKVIPRWTPHPLVVLLCVCMVPAGGGPNTTQCCLTGKLCCCDCDVADEICCPLPIWNSIVGLFSNKVEPSSDPQNSSCWIQTNCMQESWLTRFAVLPCEFVSTEAVVRNPLVWFIQNKIAASTVQTWIWLARVN